MDRKRKWLAQMLQINLRWNELYWSSPFFTAESCRFRFLSAPHLHRSRKPKETPWHSPTPTRGVPGCSGKMCTSWGWWCQWYVFFLSHFLLSLSLYIFSSQNYWCVFIHDPPINQPMMMQGPWPCVFCPDFFTTWRAERGEKGHAATSPFLQWARTWGHHQSTNLWWFGPSESLNIFKLYINPTISN